MLPWPLMERERIVMARQTRASILLASTVGLPLAAVPDPNAAYAALWESMLDRVGRRMPVSPAFPRDWPPPRKGQGRVVRYALPCA